MLHIVSDTVTPERGMEIEFGGCDHVLNKLREVESHINQGIPIAEASRKIGVTGHVVKRKTRVEHDCYDCGCLIEPGEEYYQLTLRGFRTEWITKPICECCWKGRELKA